MRNNIYYAVIISLLFFTNVSYAQLIPVLGSQRAGTAMGQFLKHALPFWDSTRDLKIMSQKFIPVRTLHEACGLRTDQSFLSKT